MKRDFFTTTRERVQEWVLAGGRDVVATTRESFFSVEARAGAWVGVALWGLGRWAAGPWVPWGPEWGGEALPYVRESYSGWMVLVQTLLLVAHILVGTCWGVVVKNAWAALGRLIPRWGADRFQPTVAGLLAGTAVAVAHGAILFRDLSRHPALYTETFAHGGGSALVLGAALGHLSGFWNSLGRIGISVLLFGAVWNALARLTGWFMAFSRPSRTAMGVLSGTLALFALGVWGVAGFQGEQNEGPNLVFVSVDGLRDDGGQVVSTLKKTSLSVARVVPGTTGLAPGLVSAVGGRSPLAHGIWNDFTPREDGLGPGPMVPEMLRAQGWSTSFLSDGPEPILSRIGGRFEIARAASDSIVSRLARRQMERSPHVMAYLSGRWGRRIPLLRGSVFLTDPSVLASEAKELIEAGARQTKFFLWVHFSSPGVLSVTSSPTAALRLRGSPGTGRPPRDVSDLSDEVQRRRVYRESQRAFDLALGDLLLALKNSRLEDRTAMVVWSPRAALLSKREESDARLLKGSGFFDLPFLVKGVPLRPGTGPFAGWGRPMDLAPTLVRLAGVAPPPEWEGVPLFAGDPSAREPRPIVIEQGIPSDMALGRTLLKEDRSMPGAPGVCMRVSWEDTLQVFRDRSLLVGGERLDYRPRAHGVEFSYFRTGPGQALVADLSSTPQGLDRMRDMRDELFRELARQEGWRPQNNYWIPEAFLRGVGEVRPGPGDSARSPS